MEKKKINEEFFSNHSSDMYYVLGLIFTDGYIYQPKKGKRYVAIKLIDEQILKDINDKMNICETPKKVGITSAGNQMYGLRFDNERLVSDLESLGLHERKTFTTIFPNVPVEYANDFVRGYFDGDGCIHVSKRKNRVNSFIKNFSVLGTKDLLEGVSKHLPCKSYIRKYRKIFRLTVNKEEDIKLIYDYLYGNENILHLNRKKEHFQHTLNIISESKIKQENYINKEQEPRLTNEEFILKAKEIHGDRYDYSLVDFTKMSEEIEIICTEHGMFKQIANKHLIGHNCQKCSGSYMDSGFFCEKAKSVHGDRYDYSKVEYINNKTKVVITCTEHGEFEQTPSNHLLGRGCPECGKRSAKRRKQKTEDKKLEALSKTKNEKDLNS